MSLIGIDEVKSLIRDYTRWLGDKTAIAQINDDWMEITTPSLDRHNDYLQIYVRRDGDKYLLTDDGYIIDDLTCSGCSLDSPRRKELLDVTLMGFGVKRERDQLTRTASANDFPIRKHNLLQAMIAVNDMFYLSSPHTTSLFYESVAEWFDESDIRYTPRVKFTGKSGYDNMFDFVIPKSKQSPERLILLANNPNGNKMKELMFKWIDIMEVRGNGVISFVMLNDTESQVSRPAIEAASNYKSTPILWSERERFKDALAA
jgi:hypothetical protein